MPAIKVKVMSRQQAVLWIKSSSKIFGATFIKRTTGALRVMVCRYGVRSHAKGIGLAFDPTAKKLIVIFDMQKHAYRCIPWEGLRSLLISGVYYRIR